MNQKTTYTLSLAPHIKNKQNVPIVMWLVVLALLPSTVFAVITFGMHILLVIAVAILSACASELLFRKVLGRDITIFNGSAVITGLLLAMNLPPLVPLWIPAVGSAFAIIIAKELFGGLGHNIFNPALVGRAFLVASWPVLMTTKWAPLPNGSILSGSFPSSSIVPQAAIDALSQATPLAALSSVPSVVSSVDGLYSSYNVYPLLFDSATLKSLAVGNIGGCIGETSALLLLVGALLLLFTRIITWKIPVAYIGTFSLLVFAYYYLTGFYMPYHALLYHLLSGGLFLGAFFMATDMVTSPVTGKGMLIFGAGCGLLTFAIRIWGGYPEGVSYSILLMNATVPLIDKCTVPKIFGKRKTA
ncbi:MAG: RnfABCDGE type electron transport complex subunit D [Spirochaetes bacterium]|jgi:electron transport complex protein RnfD|nr:RnfABCDGE type electron transport complex subunit D [Spirochaetota bacterium]